MLAAAARSAGVRVDALPGVDVAVLVHRGSYDGMTETYRELGAWVAANANDAELSVREDYFVGPADTDDEERFRTEILWPIRKDPRWSR
jgi:effector-binding domain-containing protein